MFLLLRVLLFLLLPVSAFAADAEDMPMAATVPVWEPGDPVRSDEDAALARAYAATKSNDLPEGADLAPPVPPLRPAQAKNADDDLMCLNAPEGTIAPVPSPFNQWLVLVCSPIGQALVPIKGSRWVVDGSQDPVSILAQPPGTNTPPASDDFDPRYGLRFNRLMGTEAQDERLTRALAMLKLASGNQPLPRIDDVWQLDAISNIVDTRYNIFFYLQDKTPRRIIACLDQCKQALLLKVVPSEPLNNATSGLRE
ncbi:MAG: hypothetical protein GC184_09425 [Rhizobiales bacterium]|nr:hypothetical protein [Hyphomicrobiales bacterium]